MLTPASPAHASLPGEIALVSHQAGAPLTTGNGFSDNYSMSADGRYVAFTSDADNLVPGQVDANGDLDAFLYDRVTGAITLISHTPAAGNVTAGSGESDVPIISADGNFVVFQSDSNNLVTGQVDVNDASFPLDVFLYDRVAGTVTLVSRTPAVGGVTTGEDESGQAVISADGAYVAYSSYAVDLVAGQVDQSSFANENVDVFLFTRATGTNTLVSHIPTSAVTVSDGFSNSSSISADGSKVAYESDSTNLVTSQVDGNSDDIFLFDRGSGANTLVSHLPGSPTTTGDNDSYFTQISADGAWVVFQSEASDLILGQIDTSGTTDVFLAQVAGGALSLVSHAAGLPTTAADDDSFNAVISADGGYVAYESYAITLQAGISDSNADADIYLYQRSANASTLVSHAAASATTAADALSEDAVISADGRWVAYESEATNLVVGQSSPAGRESVFLYGGLTGANVLVSHTTAGLTTAPPGGSFDASISANGAIVAFESEGNDMVIGQIDGNSDLDVFVYSRPGSSLPGVVTGSTSWALRGSLTTGGPTVGPFSYGTKPLVPIMGDWNGDGVATVGTYEAGTFKLNNANDASAADLTFTYGDPRGFPVVGDWNNDGLDDVAVFRNGLWQTRLTGSGTTGSFTFGTGAWPATVPVAGDWNGDGTDGIGIYTLASGSWSLRQTATAGATEIGPFTFWGGSSTSYPVVGDWNADGFDSVGVKIGTTWFLNNQTDNSAAEVTFLFGAANDFPVIWRNG